MPLTKEQEQWLNDCELTRQAERKAIEDKRNAEALEAKKKKEAKDKKKEGGDKKKDKKKDGKKKDKEEAVDNSNVKLKVDARAYMAKTFPTFDIGESVKYKLPPVVLNKHGKPIMESTIANNPEDTHTKSNYNLYNLADLAEENYGPMRTMQMIECNRILDVCEDWGVPMDERVLHRALIIPQDKPDAIIEDHIRNGGMDPIAQYKPNPSRQELWRKCPDFLGGKKKKGKKKKK